MGGLGYSELRGVGVIMKIKLEFRILVFRIWGKKGAKYPPTHSLKNTVGDGKQLII